MAPWREYDTFRLSLQCWLYYHTTPRHCSMKISAEYPFRGCLKPSKIWYNRVSNTGHAQDGYQVLTDLKKKKNMSKDRQKDNFSQFFLYDTDCGDNSAVVVLRTRDPTDSRSNVIHCVDATVERASLLFLSSTWLWGLICFPLPLCLQSDLA